MDASEIVKELKYRILCWLLQGIEPGFPRRESDLTTTTPLIIFRFEVIGMSYLAMWAENAIKFELAPKLVIKMEK